MPPTELIESIDAVRRRARGLSVVYGVGIVMGAALAALLLVIALDWLLNLYAWPRLILMLAGIAGVAYAAFRFIAKPATADVPLADVAGRLERAFPQFEDRLRSTVNFVDGANPGSAVLQQRTIEQAVRLASGLDLRQAVVAKPAIVSLGSAIASGLVVLLLAGVVLDRGTWGVIVSRLVTPFSAKPWPKRVQISLGDLLPGRVPVGQKIDVSLTIARGDKPSLRPILYYQIDNGPVQQVFMTRDDAGGFKSSLDARLEPGQTGATLKSWVVAGDDRQELSPVAIVPRLAIRKITATLTPPAYAPARTTPPQDLAIAPAVAAEGGTVMLRVQFNKSLGQADPVLEPINASTATTGPATQPAMSVAWERDGDSVAVARFPASVSQRFRVRATDVDGFGNTALEEYELIVKPDTNLSIQLENPRRNEERTATAFVPMQAVTEDDCGIDSIVLKIERQKPSPLDWTIPIIKDGKPVDGVTWQAVDASPDRVRQRLNYQWELKLLGLAPGDVIEYSFVAQDNFNLDGRRHDPVATPKQRITIVSQDDLAARVADELRSVRVQTNQVRSTQQRTRQETQQLKDDTKDKEQLDAGDQAAAQRLTQQQASSAASTKQLGDRVQQSIDRLNENRSTVAELKTTAESVRDTLTQTGEGAMKDAAQELANAGQPDRKNDQRAGDLGNAQEQQQKALNQLDRAMAQLDSVGSLQASIGEINSILAEQQRLRKENEDFAKQNLGKKPQDLAADNKDKLDKIAEQQSKLAERTQKALDKMATQAEQMKRSDPASSEAMAAAAKQGQQSKVSSEQKKASQQTSQNQQANAQQSQKQAELGLEQVMNELKEAQRRELARLRNQLAQLQDQIATLIRRQSGHNLDSLLLQGPEKLKAAGEKVVAQLAVDAKRQPDQALKAPEARLVTTAQELTARNARDVASSNDNSPQTAEIVARVGKAAGQMERAILPLRGGKIGEAYDPHQVDALAALLDAKKQIDQQKEDADKKEQEQQKDAIRERYVKIKAAQEALNADTTKVEQSRDANGALPRVQLLSINRLTKSQSDLADQTAKIEEDLNALGSVVYVWANRDIKQAMETVLADLKATKTAVPTQAEQERIVEELAAMIKNLEEKPPEKKFEQANNGGGQGGGQGQPPPPKMPTDAELKLLRSLQVAVNNSTTKIAAAPNPDKPRLLSLGGRQGDLRNVLDNLLKKASDGKTTLGAEPDNKDALPEEATVEDIDQKDLTDTLLGADPDKNQQKVDKDFQLVGTRMARSRQRLAINNDPGKVTQEIQKRILNDLDALIDLAQKNQQQQQQQASSGQQQPGQPKPNAGDQQQANNQGKNQGQQQQNQSQAGAVNQNHAAAGSKPHDLKDLTETASEWGAVTPRVRQAVIDSRGEAIVEQYRKLIEDYYGALSNEGGKKR
ncbi:MAG: hypothetical protein QM754_13620 [Tepidisphaeraceae bacterium]